eukprot:8444613-Pyramimonas_sp.AAC.1
MPSQTSKGPIPHPAPPRAAAGRGEGAARGEAGRLERHVLGSAAAALFPEPTLPVTGPPAFA